MADFPQEFLLRLEHDSGDSLSMVGQETLTSTTDRTNLILLESFTAEITNTGATAVSPPSPSGYEICQRTGFKELPHTLIEDGYGFWVRKQSRDVKHPTDMGPRSRPERHYGPRNPEPDDTFVSTSTVPEDL